ncbi:2-oxoglutarate ferredoxin oxidoreductase subunit alpha, partial [Streptomyces sp. NPDC059873]
MTSQVSSPAEQADGAGGASDRAVGDQRAPASVQSVQEGAGEKEVRRLDRVIIRFAGDSGDGMQLTGDRFTSETASFGNDLST